MASPHPIDPLIKILNGNPGKGKINQEVLRLSGAPKPPVELDEYAMHVFQVILRSVPPGVFGEADSFAIGAYCQTAAWLQAAEQAMNSPEFEPLIEGSNGSTVINPWFKIRQQMSSELRAWGIRLGLDPVARLSMSKTHSEIKESKFGDLLEIPSYEARIQDEQSESSNSSKT